MHLTVTVEEDQYGTGSSLCPDNPGPDQALSSAIPQKFDLKHDAVESV